jgi:hypothetical protein
MAQVNRRERSWKIVDAMRDLLLRCERAHTEMDSAPLVGACFGAQDTLRITAAQLGRLAHELEELWRWPKRKGGA